MSPKGRICSAVLAVCWALLACERTPASEKASPGAVAATATQTQPATPPPVDFETIEPSSIPSRGVPGGTEGRFVARPAVVASPCGFHLVVNGQAATWTALLVGHDLAWTKEGSPLLLRVDGLILDVGLVEAKAMGGSGELAPDALLKLTGQWESTWLRRDAGGDVAIKDNASGQAHLEPHPAWRVWSATLGMGKASADVTTTNAVIATIALDQRALVFRALLDGEKLALRALRRLVFAVDSIEYHPGSVGRREFTETLRKAVVQDPTCAAIHATHDAQLE